MRTCWSVAVVVVVVGCGGDGQTFVDAGDDAGTRRDADVSEPPVDAPVDAAIDAPTDASSSIGCADGTRDGLLSEVEFPAVAACAGTWTGDVSAGVALCAPGWHVCLGPEPALHAVTFAQATAFAGCFAYDAAQDNYVCRPDCSAQVAAGVDSATAIDLGAIGSACPYQYPTGGSCLAIGRIDAAENSGTGCAFNAAVTTGVVCCLDTPPP